MGKQQLVYITPFTGKSIGLKEINYIDYLNNSVISDFLKKYNSNFIIYSLSPKSYNSGDIFFFKSFNLGKFSFEYSFKLIFRILLDRNKEYVIHINEGWFITLLSIFIKLTGKKYSIIFGGSNINNRIRNRIFYNNSSKIIVHTNFQFNLFDVKFDGIYNYKTKVNPFGFNPNRYIERKVIPESDKLVFISVLRVNINKGMLNNILFLDKFANYLTESNNTFKFKSLSYNIIGDYDMNDEFILFVNLLEDLKIKLNKLEINFFYDFKGYIAKKYICFFYAKSNFLLHLSESESFGFVTVEAMSSGVIPILHANSIGTKEIIKPNINGYIIENDLTKFDFSLLLKGPIKIDELIKYSKKWSMNNFNWD